MGSGGKPILTLSNVVGKGDNDDNDNNPASHICAAGWSSLCSIQRVYQISQVYMGTTIPASSHDNWKVRRRDLTREAGRTSMMFRTSKSAPSMTMNARPLPLRAMTPVVLAAAAPRQPGEDRSNDDRGGCAPATQWRR